MGPTQTPERDKAVAAKPRASWWRGFKAILFLATAFYVGLAVGDGRIAIPSIGGNQAVSKNLPATLDYNEVNQIYKSLKDNYDGQLNAEQLEDGLKHGLATATKDPYTSYFTPQEAKEFQEQITNSFSGIGAQLGQDEEGNLEVVAPIEGLPAEKAGIKAKDLIATINGESTSGMSVDKAVSKIRGPKGTQVKLQVVRNRAQSLNFTITRDDIKLPSVKTRTLEDNIGYIQITDFSDDTVDLVSKAAKDFKAKNVKGIVLDMRDNPGGLLDASVKISDLWLPSGKNILQEKRGNNVVVQSYNADDGDDILKGVPTVVLINGGSASASEITAGALRDNKAAYVIGEKSYGKGVVQQLINFGDGSQLKVTVASWYRPNGQNINKKGITPDKTVKLTDKDVEADNDTQLKAAQDYLKK
jgi:carboxyl-terminal processing protease